MPGGKRGGRKKTKQIPTELRSICLITLLWNPITHPIHPQNHCPIILAELNAHPNNLAKAVISHAQIHSWSLFMCFVYCCRELSYNQIEHLPSFYRCSSLQEMWVIQTPTPPHAPRAQISGLHILYVRCVCVFLNRGLQHNQIRRIESSTFQQLTSLRAL